MSANHSTIRHSKTKDLAGNTVGRLYITQFAGYRPRPNGDCDAWWAYQCSCGTLGECAAYGLTSRTMQSCGCIRQEKTSSRNISKGITDQKYRTTEYFIWRNMVKRCYDCNDKSFQNYGGRGINVCQEWYESFLVFLADMKQRPSTAHSIERLDNNLGYSPENCAWATRTAQQRNKRTNHLLKYNNETLCLSALVEKYSIVAEDTFRYRIKHGWPMDKALRTPSRQSSAR